MPDFQWKQAGSPPAPHPLHLARKRAKKTLNSAQCIQAAKNRDTEFIYKLIGKQRKTPRSETMELVVDGNTHTGDLLPTWTFTNFALPSDAPTFDAEYREQTLLDQQIIIKLCRLSSSSANHVPFNPIEVRQAIDTFISRKIMNSAFSVFYFPGPHTAALILNLAIMLPSVLPPECVIYLIITGATKPTMPAQLVGSVVLHINST